MSATSRTVSRTVFAMESVEACTCVVRRSIGTSDLSDVPPFLLLEHFVYGMTEDSGFPDHPHRGQTAVSYMLEGSCRYEDSDGHKGIIESGGVQWMTAGRGVLHAGMPVYGPGVVDPIVIHLWIDLPKQYKMTAPSYQDLSASEVPTSYPGGPDGPVKIKVISGRSFGVESPIKPLGGCWFLHIKFSEIARIFHKLPIGWVSLIYVLKGSLRVGNGETVYAPYDTLGLSAHPKQPGVRITATENYTELLLLSAEPQQQKVVGYGPFVMNSHLEVWQAILDYRTGLNGFEKVHTWKSNIGAQ